MKSCLNCEYYLMEGGEERGRMSFDFCIKKGEYLPAAAFSFNDVCCVGISCCFNPKSFSCLEETAAKCEHYKEKK